MAGGPVRNTVLLLLFLLTGTAATGAMAATAPICEFKKQIVAGPKTGGIYALFSGPSGTGRTLTAKVLAKEHGMNLYRVDLSAIVSKYIGETEKNLARLFDRAESENLLLYFDEADSLFGKRSGVKDAKDRYGNLETEYLLSQIESHRAPVILATERPVVPKPRSGKPPTAVWFGAKGPPPNLQLKFCR